MLKTMSDKSEVAQTLAEIRDKLSYAVTQSIETAKKKVAPQVEEAAGQVVNGVVVSIMNAVSDIPGVGILLSALGFVDTGVKVIEKAEGITEELKEAAKPITTAIESVSELATTLNEAAKQSVNESVNAKQSVDEDEEAEMTPMGTSAATTSVNLDTNQSTKKEQGGGGSRKRRRIHKLSRRIARTLRRVQKKYELGLKAKDSFLRRTLNAKKLK